jgi:hypothetical protein
MGHAFSIAFVSFYEAPKARNYLQFSSIHCWFWSASWMFLIPMGHAFSMAFVSFCEAPKAGNYLQFSSFHCQFSSACCMFLIPMGHAFPMAFVSFVKHRKLRTISFPRSFFSEKSDNTHKVCLWNQEQSICEWKWASRFSYLSMYFVQVLD